MVMDKWVYRGKNREKVYLNAMFIQEIRILKILVKINKLIYL